MKGVLRKLLMGALSGVIGSTIVWGLFNIDVSRDFFYKFEAATYDYRLRKIIEPPTHPIEDVVIVDIDSRSLNELGAFQQWPRTYWARVIEILSRGHARLIGLDVLFNRSLRFPEEDAEFVKAVQSHGNVFNSIILAPADAEQFLYAMSSEPEGLDVERFRVSIPDDLAYQLVALERMEPDFIELLNAGAGIGTVNLFPDIDGISRQMPLFMRFNEHVYPAFALAMALKDLQTQEIRYHPGRRQIELKTASGENVLIPADDKSRALIYYHGPYQSFRYISFYSLLNEQIPAEFFDGKVVIFGASAPGLTDLRSTPLQPSFPGVEIHANVFQQIVNGDFIYTFSETHQFLFMLAAGIIAGILFALLQPAGGVVAAIILSFLTFVIVWLFFAFQFMWAPLVAPLVSILLTFTTHYTYRYVVEERDKREIKNMFSHYVSSSVVEELLKKPDMVKLGGEKKVCTVLFSDLAGFTSLSEETPPEELVKLLNEYLTAMTHIILNNQGTLDKYEGDAIMAFFGAPVDIPNHALQACSTALKMQKELTRVCEEWKKRGLPQFHQRIGVNTGEMIIGNMGSDIRFDYTAIGDAVNLGARLEGANKLYGTNILITEGTYKMAKEGIIVRQLDLVRVMGKQAPVKIFELVALKDDALDIKTREVLNYFQQGYQQYLAQNWEWAMNQFRQALQIDGDDEPSRLFALRCQEFINNPPGKDWDGVYTLTSK